MKYIKIVNPKIRTLLRNGLEQQGEAKLWMTRAQAKALVMKVRFYKVQPVDVFPTMLPPCFLYVQWPFIFMAILPDGSCHT